MKTANININGFFDRRADCIRITDGMNEMYDSSYFYIVIITTVFAFIIL